MDINEIYNKMYGIKSFHEGEYSNYIEKTVEEQMIKNINDPLNLQNWDETEKKINNQIKF